MSDDWYFEDESSLKMAAFFLIEIMPVMFIPAAAGLIDSWKVLQPLLLPILVITVVITIFVMVSHRKNSTNDSTEERNQK